MPMKSHVDGELRGEGRDNCPDIVRQQASCGVNNIHGFYTEALHVEGRFKKLPGSQAVRAHHLKEKGYIRTLFPGIEQV